MNIRSFKLIAIVGLIILSFVCHFMYDIFPFTITSFFFPVNESIWEHMKIIYTSYMIYGIIEYFMFKHFNIKYNNYFLMNYIVSVLSIVLYLVIYIPIYNIIGENLIISILLLVIVYTIGELFLFVLYDFPVIKYNEYISIFLIVITYVIFIILTYNPPCNYIFYDTLNKGYGIVKKSQ